MPAFLAAPLFKYGMIALVIISLAAGLFWFKHEAELARESQAVAERQAEISAKDAARWQDASDARDIAIGQLKTALDEQSAAVTAARAKEAALRASLDSARLVNDRLSVEASQRDHDADAEAEKAPGDIREVGPIVARRAKELFR